MPRNNTPIYIATAALGLLALLGGAFVFMRPAAAPNPALAKAAPTPTPVPEMRWVAARDIPPRTLVTQAMLRRVALTGDAPADAIANPTDLRGQLTTQEIRAGETVALSSFNARVRRVVPANIEVPSGYRAVAIWVDPKQTAAGLVDVGDHVDVVATHRLSQEKGKNERIQGAANFTAGRLIGSNLRVLAVDESLDAPAPTPTPAPRPDGAPADPAAPPTPAPAPPANVPPPAQSTTSTARTRVLLAARPETAMRLAAANDQGMLHVTIRNPLDSDADQQPGVNEFPSQLVPDYWAVRDELKKDRADAEAKQLARAALRNANSGGGSAPTRFNESTPALPIITRTQPEPQPLAPARVEGEPMRPMTTPPSFIAPPASAPPAPKTKEVMVIRGTEKTRVDVPMR